MRGGKSSASATKAMIDIVRSNSLADLAARINAEHAEAVRSFRAPMEHGIKAGHLLIEAKEQLKHGEWLPWLEEHCAVNPRTAQLYMRLASNEEQIRNSCGFAEALANLTKVQRQARVAQMKDRREEREVELAEATAMASEMLGSELYGVIYADPPWRFELWAESGMLKVADNHYPTMTLDSIKALYVPAPDDCVLFLWATVPMKPQALAVMEAWGFEYKSTLYWDKGHGGMGYWSQNTVEELLIGTRGDVPAPNQGEQPPQITRAPRGRHSEKPEIFAQYIERHYPNLPKLDMFARKQRPGWHVHGNEVRSPVSNVAPVDAKTEANIKQVFLTQALKRQKAFRTTRALKWRSRQR